MTTIKQDITALRALVAPALPSTTKYSLQSVPAQPAAGMLAIQALIPGQSSDISVLHERVERSYHFIYYGSTNIDVVDTMDVIRRTLRKQKKVQVGTEWITLGAFSMSQGFKTENGVEAMLGILEVTAYELREETAAPKIGTVSMTFKTTKE